MADVLTPEQRRKNMQHIKSNDTKIEVLLRKVTDTERIIRNFLENQILFSQNIRLQFSVMVSFFMVRTGRY